MVELLFLAAGALAAGGGAAQMAGPLATDWKARKGLMKRRLLDLTATAPGPMRRALGAVVLGLTLTGGALAAYAATPPASPPERLPHEAVGVLGSGDQLSLVVAQGDKGRRIKLGEDYAEGWRLTGLTPSTATLTKDGQSRQVGLNPTGAVAQAEGPRPASQVTVLVPPAIQEAIDAQADRKACGAEYAAKSSRPLPGTTEEANRDAMAQVIGQARAEQCYRSGSIVLQAMRNDEVRRAMAVARGDINSVRTMDELPPLGPDRIASSAEARAYTDDIFAPGTFSTIGYRLGVDGALYRTPELAAASRMPANRSPP